MTLHPIPLNFLIYEERFIFFFISATMNNYRREVHPTIKKNTRQPTANNRKLLKTQNHKKIQDSHAKGSYPPLLPHGPQTDSDSNCTCFIGHELETDIDNEFLSSIMRHTVGYELEPDIKKPIL
jgi:hypothetical protein